ncbi:hypothetical protein AB9_033 [Acinetobacter phage vB_AbaM_B9]|nr:hypothetical protein AB9_033 [Acinetobacter phage vB_AbaM_B9]
MNINPNKIYATYEDDDGHTYLIPYQEYSEVFKKIDALEKEIDNNRDCAETYWAYVDELNDFLDSFNRLEGESYYVILEEDLEGL